MNILLNRFIVGVLFFLPAVAGIGQDTIRFEDALLIQPGIGYNRTTFQYDPVAYEILNQSLDMPCEGVTFDSDGDNEATWEKITVGENGYFNSRKFRGGYLYIQYESPVKKIMILEATGHTMAFINGVPREGDHYNFSYSQIPVSIKAGMNHFFFIGGRFPMIKVILTEPVAEAMISARDLTLPDLITGEGDQKWAAVRIINSTGNELNDLVLECETEEGVTIQTKVPLISPMSIRKVGFRIQDEKTIPEGKVNIYLELFKSKSKDKIDQLEFEIESKTPDQMYARTFVSNIDGSIQYFAVRPGNTPPGEKPALFFSVHGAGVEARNQARAYKPKDWGVIIAPTNRRPFGFAWEDWGRLDALEVLEIGKKMYSTDPERTYLTGHSMGGHGTWYLGATYPDQFAAIAPCAGYADLLGYAVRGSDSGEPSRMEQMFIRAANPHRTRELSRNYLHHGIYILHGDADATVPVSQARGMRELLGTFHNDFTYYEYPGGSHWYGDISMDWPPIFDYFNLHTLKDAKNVKQVEFHTASPGVSASSEWITIYNQESPFDFSNVKFSWDPETNEISGTTENTSRFSIDVSSLGVKSSIKVIADDQTINDPDPSDGVVWLEQQAGKWTQTGTPDRFNKGPHRYGNFKDAFRNKMVFVYGTNGTDEENEWMFYKARFDAETFGYRGNGSLEIIKDTDFESDIYANQNVILFGNANTNKAWKSLLPNCPVQVLNGSIRIGKKELKGDDLGIYFIWPRDDSDLASIGIVAGTGIHGLKATYANQYFLAGPGFPDLTIFRFNMLKHGYEAVECAGFFGDDWSVEKGDIIWKESE